MILENAIERAPGKPVDFDPQQQMGSMIFGMRLRFINPSLRTVYAGRNTSPRRSAISGSASSKGLRMDQQLGAMYQSVLEGIPWPEETHSPLLKTLRTTTKGAKLPSNSPSTATIPESPATPWVT